MRYSTAKYGRKLIVKKPEGYVMDGETYPTLTAATDAINGKKK
jgi:hypothetical protein